MSETPMLFTDLLSPSSLAKHKKENPHAPYVEENDVIPIKTWTTGSPLAKKHQFRKDELQDIPEGVGMDKYFAKAFGDPTDEENAEEENEEQNYEEEDEGDNQVVVEDEEDGEPIKEMPDYMESGVYIEGYDEFEFDADYEDQHYTTDDYDEDVDDQNAEIEEEGDYEEEYEQDDQEVEEDEGGEEEYEDDYQNDEEEGELHESDQENDQPLFDDLIGLINSYEEMKEEVFRESQNLKQSKSKEGTTVTTPSRLSSEDALRLAEQLEQEDDEDTTSIVNEYKDLLAYLTSPAKNAELTEFSQEGANHLFDNDFDIFPSAPTKKSVKVIEKPVKQRPLQPQQHEVPVKTKKSVQPSHPANKNKQNNLFYAPGQKTSLVEDQQQSKQRQRYEENDDDLDYENEVARLVKVPKSVSHHLLDEKKGKKKNKNGKKVDHRKFYGAEVVVKKSHPLIKNHGPDKAKLLEAQRRHRDMLANMVNKRKAEEEELLALAAKAQEKRKRFKESLLEKASKARKDHDEVSEEEASPVADHRPAPVQKAVFATQAALPHHHSPSAAPKHQIIPTNRKTTNQVIADAEEIAKQEEEKREHVAAIRRKFKEQHKKLLLSLMLKKKEEELMEEQQQILDQIKKEKRKKKIAKMLSEKGHGSETPEKHLNKEGDDDEKPSAKKSEGKAQVAVGSAIQAIRQRAQSNPDSMNQNAAENSKVKKNVGKPIAGRPRKLLSEEIRSDDSEQEPTSSHNKMAEEKQRRAKAKREREEEIVIEDEGEGEENPEEIQKKLELLEAKRQFSLQQSKKIAAYLSALTEQKKKEEEEKKKKEDRQKKRIILLSQRLLKEANERKLMILEDKPNYREIYLKKNSSEVEELEKTLPARRRGSGGAPVQEGEKKKKITPEMAESIAARLSKKSNVTFEADQVSSAPIKKVRPPRPAPSNKDSNSSDDNNDGAPPAKHTNPPIPTITPTVMIYRDFNDWKRKNNVPPDARVFCMTGWYPCVKQALIDRGWHFNPDPASPYCHLKWTLRSVDVNQDTLQPWQLTNHYCKNVAITTKAGLIKSLQSLIWMANVDINDIIPRAYDLTIQDDMISFLEDYKNLKAEGILKKLYSQATGLESLITDNPSDYRPLSSSVGTSGGALSSSPLREAKKLSPTTNDDSAGEEDEEGEEKAKERVPITVTDGNDHVEGESAKPFDLNDFLLPAIPPLPESVYANPLPTILINGAIFEITCQHLESQLKPFNIGGNSTAKKSQAKGKPQRRGSGQSNTLSHTKSSNQFEEDEVSEVIASGNCENDGDDEDDDINVCDYDYCPSGYHEVNIHASTDIYTSGNAGNPANNNNYTTGVHPYINYPRSVIQGIKLVSDLHWEIIDSYSIYERVASLPFDAPEPLDQFLRGSGGNNSSSTADDEYDEITGKKYTYQQLQREKRRLMKIYEEHREEITNLMNQPLRPLTIQDIERIHKLLYQRLLYYYGKNQSLINGNDYHGYNNLWIVKPAAKSRGRGIMTFSNINKLLKYIEAGNGLSTQWIVQKYIENSLIIAKRKFDLRQWILVTSWNPLTIYFYNECYARFSVDEYSANTTSLENSYIHLVNNSIGKNSENFNKTITAENNESIEGYMWDYQSFSKYLQWSDANHENIMDKKIQPRMKEIAIYALMCASDSIEHRKNSWELYGFDFMIDDQYNTWLIEINSSPACDYSTKVTERYVQKALVELLNVVLDVREWEAQPKKQRTGEKPDTGGWECIYQGPTLDLPIGSFGADISVKGESVKGLPKRSTSYSLPVVIPAHPSGASSAMNSAVNAGDLSVVSIGANQPSDSFSATNSGSGSRSTSIKKMMAKNLIKPASNSTTMNGNVKPTIPKPNASNNRQTKPTHVNRQAHDEVLTLDDEDDDLSVATNDKFRHNLNSANGGGLSHRSNSSQPDLTSQTYDDSSDDHQGGGTSGRSSKKQGGVANKASVVHPSSNVPNLAVVGNAPPLKKEGSVVNKAAAVAAIPIKTFNVDF